MKRNEGAGGEMQIVVNDRSIRPKWPVTVLDQNVGASIFDDAVHLGQFYEWLDTANPDYGYLRLTDANNQDLRCFVWDTTPFMVQLEALAVSYFEATTVDNRRVLLERDAEGRYRRSIMTVPHVKRRSSESSWSAMLELGHKIPLDAAPVDAGDFSDISIVEIVENATIRQARFHELWQHGLVSGLSRQRRQRRMEWFQRLRRAG